MSKTTTNKKFIASTRINKQKADYMGDSIQPSKHVINAILSYSNALSIRKSKSLEHFEMILN